MCVYAVFQLRPSSIRFSPTYTRPVYLQHKNRASTDENGKVMDLQIGIALPCNFSLNLWYNYHLYSKYRQNICILWKFHFHMFIRGFTIFETTGDSISCQNRSKWGVLSAPNWNFISNIIKKGWYHCLSKKNGWFHAENIPKIKKN